MKRLIPAFALLTASLASAGDVPPTLKEIPMPTALKADGQGFYGFINMCDFLRTKVFSSETVTDHHFIAGMAAAFAIADKVKPEERADYMAAFIKSYMKAVDEDKAAPDSILKDH
jgi:hypothetical protein